MARVLAGFLGLDAQKGSKRGVREGGEEKKTQQSAFVHSVHYPRYRSLYRYRYYRTRAIPNVPNRRQCVYSMTVLLLSSGSLGKHLEE